MDKGSIFPRRISSSSSGSSTPESKSDIIAFAVGNPVNKLTGRLSRTNEHFLGIPIAQSLIQRHNDELQRCSQFYSLASLFNEKSSRDKHRFGRKNVRKMSATGRKYLSRVFICF